MTAFKVSTKVAVGVRVAFLCACVVTGAFIKLQAPASVCQQLWRWTSSRIWFMSWSQWPVLMKKFGGWELEPQRAVPPKLHQCSGCSQAQQILRQMWRDKAFRAPLPQVLCWELNHEWQGGPAFWRTITWEIYQLPQSLFKVFKVTVISPSHTYFTVNRKLTGCLTSIFRQFPTVDLVFHNISPVQGALVEVKVQGNGVPQSWYQHTELPLVELNPSDLITVGEDDERFEWIWRKINHNPERSSQSRDSQNRSLCFDQITLNMCTSPSFLV